MKDTILAKKLFTKTDLPNRGRFTATAEVASIGDQDPYFSVTGDEWENGRNVAGGCMHGEVSRYFPELAPYLRWHLTSTRGPMHYLANAIYHAGFCLGMEKSRNLDHLRSTIVYGAVEGDTDTDLETMDAEQLKQWLTDRFPRLMEQFKVDINTLFGKDVVTEIATEVEPYNGALSTPHNREVMRQKKRQAHLLIR